MPNLLRPILFTLLFLTLARPASAAVVVLYHHVSTSTPASTSISPKDFEAHMDYLAEAGFKIVPLTELAEKLRKGEPLPDKTAAITFDDSYVSVYDSAFPRLKKRGWPFTFFVNTDAVSTGKIFVTWDQLREMAKYGATIANHTGSHTHLPRRAKNETEAEWQVRIRADIERAQNKIQTEIGVASKIMAYPFGEYDQDVQKIVKALGYIGFGQQSGPLYEQGDLQAVPRFPFGGSYTDLNDFIQKVNSRPMPVAEVAFYGDNKTERASTTVKAGERPFLVLKLTDAALLKKIHCFATGQGPIATTIQDNRLWVQANTAFKAGRTRYNCTATTGEKGRFYWYTQQWLATDAKGNWSYEN